MALELKYKEFRKMSTNVSVQSYQGFWILISINELAVFSSISDTGYDTVITTLGQKDIWNGLCLKFLQYPMIICRWSNLRSQRIYPMMKSYTYCHKVPLWIRENMLTSGFSFIFQQNVSSKKRENIKKEVALLMARV